MVLMVGWSINATFDAIGPTVRSQSDATGLSIKTHTDAIGPAILVTVTTPGADTEDTVTSGADTFAILDALGYESLFMLEA